MGEVRCGLGWRGCRQCWLWEVELMPEFRKAATFDLVGIATSFSLNFHITSSKIERISRIHISLLQIWSHDFETLTSHRISRHQTEK